MFPWLEYLKKYIGTKEIPGPEANPVIVHFDSFTTLKATSDEIAWCSSAMNAAMIEGANIPGTRSAAARSWLKWGIKLDGPRIGAVVIFNRGGSPNPDDAGPGHVTCIDGFDKDYLYCIGGNQGDMVKRSKFDYQNVLGYRWPEGFK